MLYAPGWAIQTIDLLLSDAVNPEVLICRPLGEVRIAGRVVAMSRLAGCEVRIQAKYVARCAQPFLGTGGGAAAIPMGGSVDPEADGVPFSQCPTWCAILWREREICRCGRWTRTGTLPRVLVDPEGFAQRNPYPCGR